MSAPPPHPGDALEHRLARIGSAALVAFVALVLALRWIIPIEDAVWRAILLARGCGSDALVERAVDLATPAAAIVVTITLLRLVSRVGIRGVWPLLAVIAVGALANTVLKEVLTRERPSMLPGVAIGHGFPSGHVMNTAIAALVVVVASARLPHARWWRAAGLVLLAVVVAARVLAARHWPADALGALLAALAFVGLALPVFRARPRAAPLALAVVLAVSFAADRLLGASAWTLPSPLDPGSPLVAFDARDGATRAVLSGGFGAWKPDGKPLPSVALHGAGVVTLAPDGAARDDVPATLAVAVLPARDRCTRVTVRVNGRQAGAFVPYIGWREYRLPLGATTLAAATDVEIAATHADGAPAPLSVAYVRVSASAPGEK
jgi:membrane-associated phospholipid phosphatase